MAAETHPCALPRGRRLKLPGEFSQVRKVGRRLIVGCLILNWKEAATSRLGVVTSRKIGNAVVRNRARRLMRECFRQHQSEFNARIELVMVARNSIKGRKLADVEYDFLAALKRAGLIQGK